MNSKRFPISNLNPHLICILCSGYLIDATTIIECLHTFCKSCIVRYFESSKFCPICDVQVHKTDPLLSIRPDSVLQKLVYKLAPKIHHKEMCRRKKFYATNIKSKPVSLEDAGCDLNRKYVLPEDVVCLALKPISDDKKCKKEVHPRYFKCPAAIHIFQLIKLIKGKFDLPLEHPVSLFTENDELLPNSISLVDVACMKSWQRKQLMVLYYKIYFSKKIKFDVSISCRPGIAEQNVQLNMNDKGRDTKPAVTEQVLKKPLPKIAPAPPKMAKIDSKCLTSNDNVLNSTKKDASLLSYNAVLPLHTNTADIITINPYNIQPQENLANNYGMSVLPLCSPTVLPTNLLNSFALTGAVLPMGISLGTNLICPSLTNPVINQNITNIDLTSIPVVDVPKKCVLPPSCIKTSVVNSINSIPISSIIKTETDVIQQNPQIIERTDLKNSNILPDREVHLTISENGVISVKSDENSDMRALIKPIEKEACELLSQIETNTLVDSEDSKESDVPGSTKLSEIKQEISLIIDNLMEVNDEIVYSDIIDKNNKQLTSLEDDYKTKCSLLSTLTTISPSKKLIKITESSPMKSGIDDLKKAEWNNSYVTKENCQSKNMQSISNLPENKTDASKTHSEATNKFKSKIISKAKKSQSMGYKTLKSSPRGWNPIIQREQILQNSTKDRTANKFFKCRSPSLSTNLPSKIINHSLINKSTTIINNNSKNLLSFNNKSCKKNSDITMHTEHLLAELKVNTSEHEYKSNINAQTVKDNNLFIKSNHPNRDLVKNSERNKINNNNIIGTCCSEGKMVHDKDKIVDKPESKKELQPQPIITTMINNKKVLPLRVEDRKRSKTKQEENKRKSSVPKKTIRVQSQRCNTPDSQDKIIPSPIQSSSKISEVTPSISRSSSIESYSDIRNFPALSSLFPTSILSDVYKSCLPLNLTNGFSMSDISSSPYLSGLCSNVFQNLLLQASSLSPQDTLSLLANKDSNVSNLLGMNFSNSSSSRINNSYIGLESSSSQLSNNNNLLTSWLRSHENRNSFLVNNSPLSPVSASNVLSFGNKCTNSGIKDSFSHKILKSHKKDTISSPKTSPSYIPITSNILPSLGTQKKDLTPNNYITLEKNINTIEVNLHNKVKSCELPKTDLLKVPSADSVFTAKSPCHIPKTNISLSVCQQKESSFNSDKHNQSNYDKINVINEEKSIILKGSSNTNNSVRDENSVNEFTNSCLVKETKMLSEEISLTHQDLDKVGRNDNISIGIHQLTNSDDLDDAKHLSKDSPETNKDIPESNLLSKDTLTPTKISVIEDTAMLLLEDSSTNKNVALNNALSKETHQPADSCVMKDNKIILLDNSMRTNMDLDKNKNSLIGSHQPKNSFEMENVKDSSKTNEDIAPNNYLSKDTRQSTNSSVIEDNKILVSKDSSKTNNAISKNDKKFNNSLALEDDTNLVSKNLLMTNNHAYSNNSLSTYDHKISNALDETESLLTINSSKTYQEVEKNVKEGKIQESLDLQSTVLTETDNIPVKVQNFPNEYPDIDSSGQFNLGNQNHPLLKTDTKAKFTKKFKKNDDCLVSSNKIDSNPKNSQNVDGVIDLINNSTTSLCSSITAEDCILNSLENNEQVLLLEKGNSTNAFEDIPNNLPICSTPNKESVADGELGLVEGFLDRKESTSKSNCTELENESYSSSEHGLQLVLDEEVCGSMDTSNVLDTSKTYDIVNSLNEVITDPKKCDNKQSSQNVTAATISIDPSSSSVSQSIPEDSFEIFNSAERNKSEQKNKSTEILEPTFQNDPLILLTDQYTKKAIESSFSKNNLSINNSFSQKITDQLKSESSLNKSDRKAQEISKSTSQKNQNMSNFSSTDEFLQQLQSMSFPQSCGSNTQKSTCSQQDAWGNNFLTNSNNSTYDYAYEKPYTTDSQTCSQQYSFKSSVTPSKNSNPRSQFNYNDSYDQHKVQGAEANNSKKISTSQDNYSGMSTTANPKYSHPFYPFSNCGYNSNFFGNNSSQSSNISSIISGAGYNLNFTNPKMYGGQQAYFPFNQGSTNNYISGAYGNNSGTNYQNCMNQYGFSSSNMNSNFGNNFGGSFSNFPLPYYNYNSYSHLYQGDNVGLMSHPAPSLMPSFPVSSRSSLSPRNTNTPQSFNDLSFQSSLFPVMPFVSGLQGSSNNTAGSQIGSVHPSKYSPKSSGAQKSTQKGVSKSRKGSNQSQKNSPTKAKNSGIQKSGDNFGTGHASLYPTEYTNKSTNSRVTEGKLNKEPNCCPLTTQKSDDSSLQKSGQQMEQKTHYQMDHRNAAAHTAYSNSSFNFDPSTSNVSKSNKEQSFPNEFPAIGSMYNAHLYPNCNFH